MKLTSNLCDTCEENVAEEDGQCAPCAFATQDLNDIRNKMVLSDKERKALFQASRVYYESVVAQEQWEPYVPAACSG